MPCSGKITFYLFFLSFLIFAILSLIFDIISLSKILFGILRSMKIVYKHFTIHNQSFEVLANTYFFGKL